jgi:hypothetical protein
LRAPVAVIDRGHFLWPPEGLARRAAGGDAVIDLHRQTEIL